MNTGKYGSIHSKVRSERWHGFFLLMRGVGTIRPYLPLTLRHLTRDELFPVHAMNTLHCPDDFDWWPLRLPFWENQGNEAMLLALLTTRGPGNSRYPSSSFDNGSWSA